MEEEKKKREGEEKGGERGEGVEGGEGREIKRQMGKVIPLRSLARSISSYVPCSCILQTPRV